MSYDRDQPAGGVCSVDCISETFIDFMLPFFLAGAGGDVECARAAIFGLLDAYDVSATQELDLASRIIIFSMTAMDSLRQSMADPTMSDSKRLRYRSNAVALNKSAEQCRTVLAAMQEKRLSVARNDALGLSTAAPAAEAPFVVAKLPALQAGSTTAIDPPSPPPEPAKLTADCRPPEGQAKAAPAKAEPANPTVKLVPPAVQSVQPVPQAAAPNEQAATSAGSAASNAEVNATKLDPCVMIDAPHATGRPSSALPDPLSLDQFAAAKAAAHRALAAAGLRRSVTAATGTPY